MIPMERLDLWVERLKSNMRLHRAEQLQVLQEYIELRRGNDAQMQAVLTRANEKDTTINALRTQIQSLNETIELLANKPKEEEQPPAPDE